VTARTAPVEVLSQSLSGSEESIGQSLRPSRHNADYAHCGGDRAATPLFVRGLSSGDHHYPNAHRIISRYVIGPPSDGVRCVARGFVIVASVSASPRAGQQERVCKWRCKQRTPIPAFVVLINQDPTMAPANACESRSPLSLVHTLSQRL
ncbi:MAG: hypothetical protein ACREPB_08140, partial [Arenimonas sp.]